MDKENQTTNNIVGVELIDPYSLKFNLKEGKYFALNIEDMGIHDIYYVSNKVLRDMKEKGYIFIKIIKKEDEKS